jgi:hypothetical protein
MTRVSWSNESLQHERSGVDSRERAKEGGGGKGDRDGKGDITDIDGEGTER